MRLDEELFAKKYLISICSFFVVSINFTRIAASN